MNILKIQYEGEVYKFKRLTSFEVYYILETPINNKKIFFSYDLIFEINKLSMMMENQYEFKSGYLVSGITYDDYPTSKTKKVLCKSNFPAKSDFDICNITQKKFIDFCQRNFYLMLSVVNKVNTSNSHINQKL